MMPRFSEQEKENIRRELQRKGKQLFALYGLKKTSVADLTKAVGIAQGTFYLFYPSKEELYFELLEQEEETIRERLTGAYFQSGSPVSRETFKRFLHEALATMENNPFLRQLYDEEMMEALFRKLPPDKLERHFARDANELLPVIALGQQQGWMQLQQPETIVSLIRSLILLALQKHLIGEERYGDTMRLFVDLIADGLIIEPNEVEQA